MKTKIILGTDAFLFAMKGLVRRGEITEEQYLESVERNKRLPKELKQMQVVLR